MSWMHDDMPKATAKNPAVKIVCIWEPAEGQGVDGLPTRGFAGQIFFFTRNSTPAQVDGTVRVYLFDDQGSVQEQGKPIHQFDFLGEAWTAHLTKSMLGPSYNVFIPYVARQPWHANCSLRVRFTPEDGPTIYSDMVHVVLPGPAKTTENQPSPEAGLPLIKQTNDLSTFSLDATLKRQQLPLLPTAGRPLPATTMAAERPAPNEPRRLENARTTQADDNLHPISSRHMSFARNSRQADAADDGRAQQFEPTIRQPKQKQRQPTVGRPPQTAPDKPRRFRLIPAEADAGSDFDRPDSSGSIRDPTTQRRPQTSSHPLQDLEERVHRWPKNENW
jgi:hypothetical protein